MAISQVEYASSLIERIGDVMKYGGLTVCGLAELAGISESHLYAVLNGKRRLTESIANRIATPFGFTGSELQRIDIPLDRKLRRTPELKKFYTDNSGVSGYFTDSNKDFNAPRYVQQKLLEQGFFRMPQNVAQVRKKLLDDRIKLSSKQISQILNYMVVSGKLKKKKTTMILQDGTQGERQIDVFYEKRK